MALSAAEKQRRYRQRRDADSQRRTSYLQKEKEKYIKDKEQGKRKNVKDMTDREKRKARKEWRTYKRIQKLNQKLIETIETPPATPEGNQNCQNVSSVSRQKVKGHNVIKRNRQKMKREIERLKVKLSNEKNKSEMYRKRYIRMQNPSNPQSPRTKASKLLNSSYIKKGNKSTTKVKRTLTFHYALLDQIRSKKGTKHKTISEVAMGAILRKYKFRTRIQTELGIYGGRVVKTNRRCVSYIEREQVKRFYERSDVSRVTTGIKSTLTRGKQKQQKRLLTDTIRNVYKLYQSEHNTKISFTTFYRLKPFWVVSPKESERDTCLCKLCENIRLTSKALVSLNVIQSQDKQELFKHIVCNEKNKTCMYRKCLKCKNNRMKVPKNKLNDTVEWKYWITREKQITKNGKEKVITTVVKETRQTKVSELMDTFNDDLSRYAKHCFNIASQNNYYMKLKGSLDESQALICVDFSENYVGKMGKEIQSMHFGASKPQLSLHTGIFYVGQNPGVSFTTVSDCLEHGPAGVWGHLMPILDMMKKSNPKVDKLHIFSDGPVTQYKQKGNFYIFSRQMEKLNMSGTWNYHESGHGRGIPDGIGAVVKRIANRVVLNGEDVMSAHEFVEKVQERTKVKLIEVKEAEIENFSDILASKQLKAVPGTMNIHQVKTEKEGEVKVRDLSCMCENSTCCKRENPEKTVSVVQYKPESKNLQVVKDTSSLSKHANKYYEYLNTLRKCKNYEGLKQEVSKIKLPPVQAQQRYMVSQKQKLDDIAFDDLPDEFEEYPVIVKSDGDCLPSCGSVFIHGNTEETDEVRLRIVHELCTNDDLYLSDEYLEHQSDNSEKHLTKSFAMYSDYFVPGVLLTDNRIRNIYEAEVMSICTPRTFMGIWQLYALASVLGHPLFSVYPERGNPVVRQQLHRIIHPRIQSSDVKLHIMWTATRDDMPDEHWVPNHFVPLLPIAPPDLSTEKSAPEQTLEKMEIDFKEDTATLLNKYVAVRYDGKPYPGQVVDVSESEVFVRCLHQVGTTKNEFYWPKLVKDECWYELDNVIAVLDKPHESTSKSGYQHLVFEEWESIK